MWPSGFGDQSTAPHYASAQIAYQDGSKVERLANSWTVLPSTKAIGGTTIPGPVSLGGGFGAILLRHFHAAGSAECRNGDCCAARLKFRTTLPTKRQADRQGGCARRRRWQPEGATSARLYVGPKSLADLEAVPVPGITGAEPDLRAVVDFGWLGLIARPLFLWLKWMYNHIVANWGWAILLQTLVINLALLPLRLSQMKSMLKMQRVAPQIKSIQEKYKKYSLRDPRKAEMNTEISALYKKEGVNPAGGCLPLVIQMPFLFAYYRMLGVAMDLRHAPWLWVHDLSSPDPLHILPIAIVVTMFFMQRYDAAGGHGSVATEDDEHHDARHAGSNQLEPAGWPGSVLVGGTVDRHRAAGGDESHLARTRDARDDGEAREKEREIAISCQLLAVSVRANSSEAES